MADFKKILTNMFIYKGPHKEHDFVLPETVEKDIWKNSDSSSETGGPKPTPTPISTSLSENIEFLKVKYNSLINSDVVFREITIPVHEKKYNALLVLIDGMSSSDLINNFILKPLMVEQPIKEGIQKRRRYAPLRKRTKYRATPKL